ncbi:HAMP domain-containing protein [Ramlibacter sp. G-1-2-2]|uniref:HAMP domain-containing protein n=1 Tax=Ramlibacter agri TaxID=2728837 RepID=A0A848H751_9BURK|nr:methyl-accepting chemotaxis protein [Ramlibacter agri]NML46317.1 HAMP domain-containing protein [Ramlibacter agri]
MKVWQKILVAPAVTIVFLLALGAVSYVMLTRQNNALEELARNRMSAFQTAADAAGDIAEVHSNVYRLFTWIANLKDDQIKKVNQEQRQKIAAVVKSLGDLNARVQLVPAEKALVADVLPKIEKYRKLMDDAIDISSADVATGAMSMQAADTQFQEIGKDMDKLVALEKSLAQESYDSAAAAFRMALAWLGVIVVAAAVAAFGIALVMSRVIVRPLQVAMRAADRIAGGDLSGDIEVRTQDETGQLLQALQTMLRNLRDLVGQVSGGAHAVADTSAQIAQGNLDLSQRTEEQATTLEETASSMEELTSTVSQNAANARQANQLASNASDVARKGGQVVGQVVSTMNGISDASKKIADIIGVIDGIAFQTNILALNAAVEAARAGEQGRGFAVVAAEVRSLAQRSAGAAKEIKELIGDSVGKVDAGTRLVADAGKTMDEIVSSVKKVSDLIAEIAAASQEQSSGIEQVNTAVTTMDQVVQQNASLVEEASAAAEAMKDQARSLLEMVARFRLGDAQSRPRAAAPAPAPAPAPAAIAPIATRSKAAPAIPARANPKLPFAPTEPRLAANGDWKEF